MLYQVFRNILNKLAAIDKTENYDTWAFIIKTFYDKDNQYKSLNNVIFVFIKNL